MTPQQLRTALSDLNGERLCDAVQRVKMRVTASTVPPYIPGCQGGSQRTSRNWGKQTR